MPIEKSACVGQWDRSVLPDQEAKGSQSMAPLSPPLTPTHTPTYTYSGLPNICPPREATPEKCEQQKPVE